MRYSLIRIGLVFMGCTVAHAVESGDRADELPASDGTRLETIKQLSLEELMQLEVSTVSRKAEQWWSAPGAIDVLTGEDIRRSGALSLPDALRLAAGVHVTQPAARSWGIGMRGFTLPGGNKINVQIDGRTVFTPFYSGVFWDAQDVMMADIDRIEVVRGPVGALWGAYAVNGFIQILTKPAWETQGGLASAAVSTENAHVASLRFGGRIDDDTFYRVYAQYRAFEPTYQNEEPSDAASDMFRTGFRVDARGASDTTTTVQGDLYSNKDGFRDGTRDEILGGNLMARWQRLLSFDSDAQLLACYDYTDRLFAVGLRELRHTLQLNGKYRVTTGRNEIQVGTDNMVSWDRIGNTPFLLFDPARRRIHSISAFANHTFHWVPERFSTMIGVKVEHNSFSDFEYQPTARAVWTPTGDTTLWAAVSRAVRTPVRFDHDVVFPFVPGLNIFEATEEFDSEEVIAYELGLRQKLSSALAVDLAWFYNDYDNLRAYRPLGSTLFPWTFRNTLNAESNGVEVAVLYQPFPRLFLKGTYRYLDMDLSYDPDARNPVGPQFEMNDPRHLGTLTTRLDLPANVEFDATARHVGGLPWQETKGYTTIDLRLGWSPREDWTLDIIGRNLLDPYHVESIIPQEVGPGREVARSVTFRATWKF